MSDAPRTGLERQHTGWTRLSDPKASNSKCRTHWRHESGWEVRHCGHPTALWPYSATHPDVAELVVSHAGVGFDSLVEAFEQIGALIAGTAVLDNGQGNRGAVRRIRMDGDAHWVPQPRRHAWTPDP